MGASTQESKKTVPSTQMEAPYSKPLHGRYGSISHDPPRSKTVSAMFEGRIVTGLGVRCFSMLAKAWSLLSQACVHQSTATAGSPSCEGKCGSTSWASSSSTSAGGRCDHWMPSAAWFTPAACHCSSNATSPLRPVRRT